MRSTSTPRNFPELVRMLNLFEHLSSIDIPSVEGVSVAMTSGYTSKSVSPKPSELFILSQDDTVAGR